MEPGSICVPADLDAITDIGDEEPDALDAAAVEQIWDGKDAAGQMLPAGTYTTVWSAKTAEGRSVFPEGHTPVRVAALNTTHADLEDGRQIGIEQILKWLQA